MQSSKDLEKGVPNTLEDDANSILDAQDYPDCTELTELSLTRIGSLTGVLLAQQTQRPSLLNLYGRTDKQEKERKKLKNAAKNEENVSGLRATQAETSQMHTVKSWQKPKTENLTRECEDNKIEEKNRKQVQKTDGAKTKAKKEYLVTNEEIDFKSRADNENLAKHSPGKIDAAEENEDESEKTISISGMESNLDEIPVENLENENAEKEPKSLKYNPKRKEEKTPKMAKPEEKNPVEEKAPKKPKNDSKKQENEKPKSSKNDPKNESIEVSTEVSKDESDKSKTSSFVYTYDKPPDLSSNLKKEKSKNFLKNDDISEDGGGFRYKFSFCPDSSSNKKLPFVGEDENGVESDEKTVRTQTIKSKKSTSDKSVKSKSSAKFYSAKADDNDTLIDEKTEEDFSFKTAAFDKKSKSTVKFTPSDVSQSCSRTSQKDDDSLLAHFVDDGDFYDIKQSVTSQKPPKNTAKLSSNIKDTDDPKSDKESDSKTTTAKSESSLSKKFASEKPKSDSDSSKKSGPKTNIAKSETNGSKTRNEKRTTDKLDQKSTAAKSDTSLSKSRSFSSRTAVSISHEKSTEKADMQKNAKTDNETSAPKSSGSAKPGSESSSGTKNSKLKSRESAKDDSRNDEKKKVSKNRTESNLSLEKSKSSSDSNRLKYEEKSSKKETHKEKQKGKAKEIPKIVVQSADKVERSLKKEKSSTKLQKNTVDAENERDNLDLAESFSLSLASQVKYDMIQAKKREKNEKTADEKARSRSKTSETIAKPREEKSKSAESLRKSRSTTNQKNVPVEPSSKSGRALKRSPTSFDLTGGSGKRNSEKQNIKSDREQLKSDKKATSNHKIEQKDSKQNLASKSKSQKGSASPRHKHDKNESFNREKTTKRKENRNKSTEANKHTKTRTKSKENVSSSKSCLTDETETGAESSDIVINISLRIPGGMKSLSEESIKKALQSGIKSTGGKKN